MNSPALPKNKFANLPYYESGELRTNERCWLDVFPAPKTNRNGSVLVWFHGGGMVEGNKEGGEGMAEMLAARGISLVMANYRLNPQANYPAYVEDAAHAISWIHRHATEYGLNPKRVFFGGISAGAYLAAIIAMDERRLTNAGMDPKLAAGAIILSGQVTTHFTIRAERGISANTIISDEASPMYYCREDTMPLLLMVADNDMPARLEEKQYFTAVLKNAGNTRHELKVIPDRDHCSINNRMTEPGDPVGTAMLDFICTHSR